MLLKLFHCETFLVHEGSFRDACLAVFLSGKLIESLGKDKVAEEISGF